MFDRMNTRNRPDRQASDDAEGEYPGLDRPHIVLPLSSVLPSLPILTDAVPTPGEALLGAVGSVRRLADRVRGGMLSPDTLVRQMEWTTSDIAVLARTVPATTATVETSEVEGSIEYDQYFGFRRIPDLSPDVMAAQILTTSHAVLVEMSQSLIGIDEVIAALDTIGDMLTWCAAVPLVQPVTGARLVPRRTVGEPVERRAEYRWVVGHHLFNLATIFCLNQIRRGQEHAVAGDANGTADALLHAARFLRATTAAMWFAGNFPAAVYIEHIRPAMAAYSGDEAGFSGTQNLDYFRLRRAIADMRTVLKIADVAAAAAVRVAHDAFTEVEIQDVEHHVLIAAAKVGGTEPSLLTRASQASLPAHVAMVPAVEMLRDLAALRRSTREHLS